MQSEVSKWGNSIALRIPAKMARDMGVAAGSNVEIVQEGNRLIITPSKLSKAQQRKELLARIIASAEAIGPDAEMDWGADVGREIVEW